MTGKRNTRNVQISPTGSPTSGNISDSSSSKEQERFLPIANVSRIMKKSLPANAKISKEAKEAVQECVSEFISFVTGEASDKCQREKRKTVNGDDLLWAMTTLGFENYVGSLKVYLNRYRETEWDKNMPVGNDNNDNIDDSFGLGSVSMKQANRTNSPPLPLSSDNLLLLPRGHSLEGGFYSLGGQGIGYGDGDLMGGGFDLNMRINGSSGGNGSNGAMAAQVPMGLGGRELNF